MSVQSGKSSDLCEDDWKDDDFLAFNTAPAADVLDSESKKPSSHSSRTDFHLPPWMDTMHTPATPRLVALHNEMVRFVKLMEPTREEIQLRETLIANVRKLVDSAFQNQATMEVFGSQATGLFLPSSDIDIVIFLAEEEHQESAAKKNANADNALPTQSPLHKLAQALRDTWLAELSYLEVIEHTRVPLVKFTHAPTDVSVDICFQQETGTQAAALMKSYLQSLPPLRPLTICLKYFLASRDLHQPYTGGVGSYMLQLMIVSMLQHRARDAVNFRRPCVECLGSLLLEFFGLYGLEFNYVTTGISVRHDGFYFPKGAQSKKLIFWQAQRPFSCAIENPLDITMDVGQTSFRINLVQRAFAVAYRILLAHVAEPSVPATSILASILTPTEEMLERKRQKRKEVPLQAKRANTMTDRRRKKKTKRRR